MKRTLLFLATLAASFHLYAQPYRDEPPGPPRPALGPTQVADANKSCYPKEAGFDGVNYTAEVYPDGIVYSWWCKRAGEWRGYSASTHSKTLLSPKSKTFKADIQTVYVQSGYAGDAGSFLVEEAKQQLRLTKPK